MTENQAFALLDFIDSNWESFKNHCEEREEDSETVRSEIEKVAMGD